MKVLITGISGFVGKYLVEELVNEQPDIEINGTYFDDKELPSLGDLREKIELHSCNIGDPQQVQEVLAKVQPDQIYHLAAMSSGAEEDRQKVFAVNVDGTLNILQACKKLDKKVKILLASTGYVYGSSDNARPFSECGKIKPMGIYAESKTEMEKKALGNKPKNVELVISRAFNHTGPGQTPNFVIPAFAQQIADIEAAKNDPTILVGNLEATRDFFDVRDAVRAYRLIMNDGKPGEIYNMASNEAIKISDLLDKLLTLSTKKISIKQDKERLRPSDLAYSVGDYSKIKSELGWSPAISLDQTLLDVLEYWRQQALL